MNSPVPKETGPISGWRGKPNKQAPKKSRGWRRVSRGRERSVSRPWYTLSLTGAALIFLGCFAWFLSTVLIAPAKTPILFIVPERYDAPFAPHCWATEDRDHLLDLDGVTLTAKSDQTLDEFDRHLESLAKSARRAPAVVVWIAMPAATNDEGKPCLIPSDASPIDTRTWIPIERFLERLRAIGLPDRMTKLIVIDPVRKRTDLQQAILENNFVKALEDSRLVESSTIPNLSLMVSCGPGETNRGGHWINGTVFGHYFRRGISGDADKSSEGGNSDRRISLAELQHYLEHHVSQWAAHFGDEDQQPVLLTNNDQVLKRELAWASRNKLPAISPAAPTLTAETMQSLWDTHDRLRSDAVRRLFPDRWRNLQKRLVRLAELNYSGRSYIEEVRSEHSDLIADFAELRADLAVPGIGVPGYRPPKANANDEIATASPMPTLSLAKTFGTLSDSDWIRLTEAVEALPEQPTAEQLRELGANFRGTTGETLATTRWLDLFASPRAGQPWGDRTLSRTGLLAYRRSDALGTPTDIRLQAHLTSGLNQANSVRRRAEDQLRLGPTASTTSPVALYATAKNDYDSVAKRSETLAHAFAVRDRALAEIPWYLDWLGRSRPLKTRSAADREQLVETLFAVINATLRLSQSLPNSESASTAVADLETKLEELAQLFDAEALAILEASEKTPERLSAIKRLLSVALIPTGQRAAFRGKPNDARSRLRNRSDEILKSLIDRFQEQPAGSIRGRIELASAARPRFLPSDELASLLMLQLEIRPETKPEDMDAMMGAMELAPLENLSFTPAEAEVKLRRWLRVLPRHLDLIESRDFSKIGPTRTKLAWFDRWVRAGSLHPLGRLPKNPTLEWRRLEWHSLLETRTTGLLSDFWAASPGFPQPFFATATKPLLDAMRHLERSQSPSNNDSESSPSERFRKRIELLAAVSRTGVLVRGAGLLVVNDVESPSVPVTVGPAGSAPEKIPPGIAGLALVHPKESLLGPTVPVPVGGKSLTESRIETLTLTKPVPARHAVVAELDFRGHQISAPIAVENEPGNVTVQRPGKDRTTSITLVGDSPATATVVLILDCSRTMATPVGGGRTRFDVAREALLASLAELAARPKTRVGVILYGHRVAWNAKKPTTLLRRQSAALNVPDDLLPFADVQTILGISEIDQSDVDRVSTILSAVEPWGESPLYLALRNALMSVREAQATAGDARIVLLTDGRDNQRRPTDRQLTPDQQSAFVSNQSLLATLSQQQTPIDIVGVSMSDFETRQVEAVFSKIVQRSGGRYRRNVASENLKAVLAELTPSLTIELRTADGTQVGTARAGQALIVDPPPEKPTDYQVKIGGQSLSLTLRGGEAIQLTPIAGSERVGSVRYLQDNPRFVPLLNPAHGGESQWLVGLHDAYGKSSSSGEVLFKVSFQRADRNVAAPPNRLLIQVLPTRPTTSDSSAPVRPYWISQPVFETRTPVPVVSWAIPGWPPDATGAKLRVWANWSPRGKPEPPQDTASVQKLLKSEGIPAVSSPKMRARYDIKTGDTNAATLRLVQLADSTEGIVVPWRVVFVDGVGGEVPFVSRSTIVSATQRIVIHEWRFERELTEDQLRTGTFQIWKPDPTATSWYELTQPTTVPVRRGDGLMILRPPENTATKN